MDFYKTNIKNGQIYFDKYINPKLKTPMQLVEKESSTLMKFIGWFLAITNINKTFMTNYITTLGSTVYYPKKLISEIEPKIFVETMMHESVHALDSQKHGFLFQITYLPELYFGLPLFLFSILSIVLKSYMVFGILFALFLIAILPIPKFGRYHWEMRAYATSLVAANLFDASDDYKSYVKEWIKSHLMGSAYYFALPISQFYSDQKYENYINSHPLKEEIKTFFTNDFIS